MNMRTPAFNLAPRPRAVRLAGKHVLVLGLGDTGLAVARWVAREGGHARVADNRAAPPRAAELAQRVPDAELRCGAFDATLLEGIDLIVPSPGLALSEPIIQRALDEGIALAGEIELFAWHVRASQPCKIAAITGTNGKTTVTALTGRLLSAAGIDCEVAGNIGPSALEALLRRQDSGTLPAAWVLELSSYQLETTWSLDPEAAAMLNLGDDHLDRYADRNEYGAAKARLFLGRGVQVLNRDDPASFAMALPRRELVTFGLGAPPRDEDFGLLKVRGERWLTRGRNPFFAAASLPVRGMHNAANALAASALARCMGAPYQALAAGLRAFQGLPHRLQLLGTRNGVEWFDDSKGTNVGATLAALEGLALPSSTAGKTLLVLGGEGKGQDFSPLADAVGRHASRVFLIGRDAPIIGAALVRSGVPLEYRSTLEEVVEAAAHVAQRGDRVLLSPACASFDMFRDYAHRGDSFARAVRGLPGFEEA